MGELVRGSLNINDLRRIKQEGSNELFNNLSLFNTDFNVDPIRTSSIDFSKKIGSGFQGSIYLVSGSDNKVVKLLKLRRVNEVTDNEIVIATSSIYASNIGVGPVIYGSPFITSDGKYVAIIMDKVTIYKPTESDVGEIINLFEKMIENKFMTFDMEYGKTLDGKIVLLDFGVSGFYNSKYETLQSAINNDLFFNTGFGYYNKTLEDHFNNLMRKMESEKSMETIGGHKKKKRTITKSGKKVKKDKVKKRKTRRIRNTK
jgi:hypothetical protein